MIGWMRWTWQMWRAYRTIGKRTGIKPFSAWLAFCGYIDEYAYHRERLVTRFMVFILDLIP